MRRTAVLSVLALLAGLLVPLLATPAASAAANLPGVATIHEKRVIGHSVQGRPITAFRLGTPGGTPALLVGQIHGDENVGVTIAQKILKGRPIKGIDLWVVATMNPDGRALGTRGNAHGVDLNRNWPHIWTHLSGINYSGRAPLSEPESKAMYAFLKQIEPKLMIVIHQPLGGVDTNEGGTRNVAFRNALARGIGLPIKTFNCWSVCHGSMAGWVNKNQTGAVVTIEYGAHPSAAQVRRSPGVILRAFGASYDKASLHNPHAVSRAIVVSGRTVKVRAFGWDPDVPGARLRGQIWDNGRLVLSGLTNVARPAGNARFGVSGTHGFWYDLTARPGRHTYCVRLLNQSWGSLNAKFCRTVTVR